MSTIHQISLADLAKRPPAATVMKGDQLRRRIRSFFEQTARDIEATLNRLHTPTSLPTSGRSNWFRVSGHRVRLLKRHRFLRALSATIGAPDTPVTATRQPFLIMHGGRMIWGEALLLAKYDKAIALPDFYRDVGTLSTEDAMLTLANASIAATLDSFSKKNPDARLRLMAPSMWAHKVPFMEMAVPERMDYVYTLHLKLNWVRTDSSWVGQLFLCLPRDEINQTLQHMNLLA